MPSYHSQLASQMRTLFVLFLVFVLNGCGGHAYHVVKRGETLYSIGWAYGYDYRQVAKWNGIKSPYHLNPGRRLRVVPPGGQSVKTLQEYQPDTSQVKINKAAPVTGPSDGSASAGGTPSRFKNEIRTVVSKVKQMLASKTLEWRWPTNGRRLLQTFSSKDPSRQGLDISGKSGAPVYAAASGRVVYAGSGLAHYGRLIIIKHNEKYLSAYAHNNKLHVKEGDAVKVRQKIADMGSVSANGGANRSKLHFEIRQNGKPVNPLRFLPRK